MECKDKRMKDGSTTSVMARCHWCGQSFERFDDGKGTPQLYCSKVCKGEAKRKRRNEILSDKCWAKERAIRNRMKELEVRFADESALFEHTSKEAEDVATDSIIGERKEIVKL